MASISSFPYSSPPSLPSPLSTHGGAFLPPRHLPPTWPSFPTLTAAAELPSRFTARARSEVSALGEVAQWGISSRERWLLRARDQRRTRVYDRVRNYPKWAKDAEEACQHDLELRELLGDSIGDPQLMAEKISAGLKHVGRDLPNSKTASTVPVKVSFRDFNSMDSYIWFQLYAPPSDLSVDILGGVIQAWYVMGRLGSFNSSNLQLAAQSIDYNPMYDEEKASGVLPASFHDISDVEFQDNWARVWVDLGTADNFALDVLINCLTVLSSEHLGIQQVVFGGKKMGDWEEGMTKAEYGYKCFRI